MARPVPALNLLLTSVVWRQDHNGFSHQDPGFLDVAANKRPDVVRIYLPPDANCLLSVARHCLQSVGHVNVIVADKQAHPSTSTRPGRRAIAGPASAPGIGRARSCSTARCGAGLRRRHSTQEALAAVALLKSCFTA